MAIFQVNLALVGQFVLSFAPSSVSDENCCRIIGAGSGFFFKTGDFPNHPTTSVKALKNSQNQQNSVKNRN